MKTSIYLIIGIAVIIGGILFYLQWLKGQKVVRGAGTPASTVHGWIVPEAGTSANSNLGRTK